MAANYRDKKVREEAQYFCRTKSLYPIQCKHFKPTLEELQSTTFSDYVRNTVLSRCEEGFNDDEEKEEDTGDNNHGTRSRSKIESSKRYEANSRKVSYDYGKLFYHSLFSTRLRNQPLIILYAKMIIIGRISEGDFTRWIFRSRRHS